MAGDQRDNLGTKSMQLVGDVRPSRFLRYRLEPGGKNGEPCIVFSVGMPPDTARTLAAAPATTTIVGLDFQLFATPPVVVRQKTMTLRDFQGLNLHDLEELSSNDRHVLFLAHQELRTYLASPMALRQRSVGPPPTAAEAPPSLQLIKD